MSGLHQSGEFGCRNESDIARTSPSDDDSFLLINHPIQYGCKVLAEAGIGCFARHFTLELIVQLSCTFDSSLPDQAAKPSEPLVFSL